MALLHTSEAHKVLQQIIVPASQDLDAILPYFFSNSEDV